MRALVLGAAALALALPTGPCLSAQPTTRGTVTADTFWSQSLGVRKQVVVYLPPSYAREPSRRYPVAYYLHGLWGDEWNWVRLGRIDAALDSLVAAGMPEMIVVMPDGDDSWYTTWNWLGDWPGCRERTWRQRYTPNDPSAAEPAATYCVPWAHYDDYIARDLVAFVDSVYRTRPDRAHRAIAGLSMGGYGAVTLALAYPEVFSAAASHSGVLAPSYVGPHPFAAPAVYASDEPSLRRAAGSFWWTMAPAFGRDTAGWFARDPGRLARRLRSRAGAPFPALHIDCGREDEFVDENRAFHAALAALGVPHEYAEYPGAHTWAYWRTHVVESLTWLAERIS